MLPPCRGVGDPALGWGSGGGCDRPGKKKRRPPRAERERRRCLCGKQTAVGRLPECVRSGTPLRRHCWNTLQSACQPLASARIVLKPACNQLVSVTSSDQHAADAQTRSDASHASGAQHCATALFLCAATVALPPFLVLRGSGVPPRALLDAVRAPSPRATQLDYSPTRIANASAYACGACPSQTTPSQSTLRRLSAAGTVTPTLAAASR